MIGNKIKELRSIKKLNQQVLAKALGVSKSSVAMWEVNKREPSLSMIGELSRFFNVPPAFLLGTGVFSNWEDIQKHKQEIIEMLNFLIKDLLPFKVDCSVDDILFIKMLDILVEKISFTSDSFTIFSKLPLNNDDTQKDTAPTESSGVDAGKQKLMNNYDLLNDEGQQDLVEYSNMLAGNPRKLK